MAVPPYGVAIRTAVADGDVERMREVEKKAEEHLRRHGDVSAALEALKVEIAKLEAREDG
jgi:F0F1-type ATP synthase epsilon subunit